MLMASAWLLFVRVLFGRGAGEHFFAEKGSPASIQKQLTT